MSENQYQKICVNRSTTSPVNEQITAAVSQQQNEQQQQLSGDGGIAAPAFEIQEKINDLYEKRLVEINELANGDASLKEITYKEWINMLRQINTTLITNIQEIDCETTKRLALLQRKSSSNCRHDQAIELCKCQRDIDSLMHLIRNARQTGDWSVGELEFETITKEVIFGETLCCESNIKKESDIINQSSSSDPKSCAVQKSKLMANLKALAIEIAERHDEMRDLKRQVISLEDDILNAQKKIQLKDDVIRELRNDLKTFPKSAATWGRRVSERLSPIDCFPTFTESKISEIGEMDFIDTPRADSYKNRDSINSLNLSEFSLPFQDDDDEENLIKRLKDELAQFFEIQESYDQSVGNQKRELKDFQQRISKMVDELVKTNHDQQNKLRFYRRELINLENPQSSRTITDEDSGISSDVDADAKIVNSVRNRISCLVDEIRRFQKEQHRLQIESEGLTSQAKAKSLLLDKTSKALREVADKISLALCKPIHYEEIFEQTSNMTSNPIVDAFGELLDTLTKQQNTIGELRTIGNTIRSNDELQENTEHLQGQLCELKSSMAKNGQFENRGKLFQNQDFLRTLFNKAEQSVEDFDTPSPQENHSEYLRIIDDLSTDINNLSCQVNMVQNEFLNDELAVQFESSLNGLEAQNDLLQAAIDSLTEEKETLQLTLQTKNEELKNTVLCLEQKVFCLEKRVQELLRKPCERCEENARFENRQQNQRTHRTSSDEKLEKLESEFRWKCKAVENLKSENEELQRELSDIRRHQTKTKLLQRREQTPDRNPNQQELLSKLNAAQKKNLEQSKSLEKISKQISCFQTEIEELHANEEVYKKERDLLHSELTALKENQASQIGIQQSLRDQLSRTTNELFFIKEKLSESHQEKCRIEKSYRDEIKRFREIYLDTVNKHNNLVEDYNEKAQEYQKLVQINQEKDNILAAFESWKKQQIQIDNEMQKKTQLFEQHIKQMLEDKQKLLDRLNETENDNLILKQTLENSRFYSSGNQSSIASGSLRGYKTSVANHSLVDPVTKVIENVRHTSRKLSHQRSILEEEAINLSK